MSITNVEAPDYCHTVALAVYFLRPYFLLLVFFQTFSDLFFIHIITFKGIVVEGNATRVSQWAATFSAYSADAVFVPANEVSVRSIVSQKSSNSSAMQMEHCQEKLTMCTRGPVGQQITIEVRDNWMRFRKRLSVPAVSAVQVKIHAKSMDGETPWQEVEKLAAGIYVVTLTSTIVGSHIVEVKVNGYQIQSSPLIIEITGAGDKTSVILPLNYLDTNWSQDKQSAYVGMLTLLSIIGIIVLGIGIKMYHNFRQARRPVDWASWVAAAECNGSIKLANGNTAKIPREVRRRDLDIIERIGGGAFGSVYKCTLDELQSRGNPSFTVAAKTVIDPHLHPEGTQELISEAAIMMQVSNHPNLLSIIGVITSGDPMVLILQYCEHGSAISYLKTKFASGHAVSHSDKMIVAIDVALGMDFLGSLQVIHRDLSARNVLLATGESIRRQESMANAKLLRQAFRRSDADDDAGDDAGNDDSLGNARKRSSVVKPSGGIVDDTVGSTLDGPRDSTVGAAPVRSREPSLPYLTAEAVNATRAQSNAVIYKNRASLAGAGDPTKLSVSREDIPTTEIPLTQGPLIQVS